MIFLIVTNVQYDLFKKKKNNTIYTTFYKRIPIVSVESKFKRNSNLRDFALFG